MNYTEFSVTLYAKLYHASTQSPDVIKRQLFLEKAMPFKMLENSKEYQLAFENIITDNEKVLETTFVTLVKFICQMYGAKNSSDVNDVRLHLFSSTFKSKKSDENFDKKIRNFDSSSLPPCKAESQQHLFRGSLRDENLEKCSLKTSNIFRLDHQR